MAEVESGMLGLGYISSHVTIGLLIATVIVIVYFLYVNFWNADSWEEYGVKQVTMGPEGLADFRQGCENLVANHGDTIGISQGGMMMLITRDLDILRQVMVKEFNNFVDRLVALCTTSPMEKGLFFLEGRDWKRIRQILSPSFSTGKIKIFSKPVDESAKKLAAVFEEFARRDQLFPVKDMTGQYTSEIIARLAFGLRTDCLGKEDDEFTSNSKKILKIRNRFMGVVMSILFRSRGLHAFLVKTLKISLFDNVSTESKIYFNSILHKTVAERQEYARKGQGKFNDLLQSMVVAKEEGDKAVAAAVAQGIQLDQAEESAPKTMTDEELMGQALLIIFAGFETTSSTLMWCLWLLAKHPDVQEKVYEEIQRVVHSESPTYEELGELKYTMQVIDETLRLFPPAPILGRKAQETMTLGDVTVPKGAYVIIPLDLIMKNPQYYEDPEKFDPDRFSDENKAKRDPMSFVPFGYGPRICIGMRLAYLELKQALVHVLRKIKVELNEHTQPKIGEDVETRFQGIIVVDKPIKLAIKLRNAS